ncbi:ABC transporter [Colletotrichum higginsianum IMI 349063]|uniref:ABC transporter n=1 Tax=Colletotrichum higginsianum (strain IMI 349063) TaxID=759273 RepID=A0A1B7YFQ2_COLHI|nr:ABC transporter [Colletotrichum higginsianum IMI 349063]OBR10917.1 ABC transporter [Colletotrichum higginsianum IMI 349063]
MSCPTFSDWAFGPRVHTECRSFDFTLQFEDVLFACLPSALFLLLAPSRVARLLRRPVAFQTSSRLLASKLLTPHCKVATTTLLAFQLAFLALRCQTSQFQTPASVAADVLTPVATLTVLLLSVLNHQRSPRPSTLLSLYLSASIILGIARVRTLWLFSVRGPLPAIATVVLGFTLVVLVLESLEAKKRLAASDPPPDGKHASPEQSSGFWSRTCFAWLATTFYLGYSKVISLGDLPRLDSSMESRVLHRSLAVTWDKYDHQSRHSLIKACFRGYLLPFLAPVIPRLCLTVFTFAQPFLIKTTVTFVGNESPDANYGRGLIGAWVLVYLGIAVSNSVYQYHNLRFTTRLRGGLIALVYQHAVHTRDVDTGDITAVALMGTDVERIFEAMSMFHMTWGSLLDIAVASWLLGLQLSLACLAPIVLVLIFIAAMSKISVASRTAQMRWIEKIQERLRVTTTVLGEMKAVKMLGLTDVMSTTIQRLRTDEINTSKSFRKLLVATLLLFPDGQPSALTPINLAPIVTFAVYVIISVFWKNETLLPAQAFASIALIGLLTTPVVMFIQMLPMIVQSFACFDRIQDFCNYGPRPATLDGQRSTFNSPSSTDINLVPLTTGGGSKPAVSSHQPCAVSFRGNSFGWKKHQAVLHDLTVDIPRNAVTVVVGPVGSGKSSFLGAILGELVPMSPPTAAPAVGNFPERGGVAYCSQSPWLENGTVRQNILGVSLYDQKWYDAVISACGLEPDLQALQKGDYTLVGSKGVNLSGGQKQRIALARAVYSRQKMVVLDDVFSGMDAHTAKHVSNCLLGTDGLLRRQRATIIIATHSHELMAVADFIICLDDGRVQELGNPTVLVQSQGYTSRLGLKLSSDGVVEKVQEESNESVIPMEQTATPTNENENHQDQTTHTDIRRKNGEKAVYEYYLKNAGWKAVTLYSVSVVMWIFFSEFSTVWVKWWSEANSVEANTSVGYYLGIYAVFGALGTLGASLAAWFAFLDIITNTALKLHSDLLKTTMAASFRFLTTTDNGEILNRFSEDMQLLDMDLPSNLVNYTSTAISILAKLVILAVFSQYLGIALPFIATVVYFLQRFYLQTSRQIRLLGIEAKAPLYTHFSESVAGGATIRAFGWQARYQERNYHRIDSSQKPSYVQSCIQAWLTFVLNLVVAVLAVVLVGVVVTWHDKFSAGSVGVSLVMVIGFSEVLARLIQSWTKLESSVGAVARVRRFVAETEAEQTAGKERLSGDWPHSGAVNFSNVVASYGPDAEPILKGVSLSVEAGAHVAICGRSGSGKTSLILSLLQMTDVKEGKIEIDGVDVSTLVPSELRSCINVVSQDPFLMPGTIQFNVDPLSAVSDDDDARITQALDRVGLSRHVQEQGGLGAEMDDKAWSAGQKQLLCMARAMLRQCKLLILDEAMSSVDSETEAVMQDVVDNEFRGCTVLAVMHRLKHVSRYDAVVLLGDGEVLEMGEPSSLIAGGGRFAELYRMNSN